MSRMSLKNVAAGYGRTLTNNRTKFLSLEAMFIQIGIPMVIGVVWFVLGPIITNYSNAIVGISIVSALLCAMATMLFQMRIDLRIRIEEMHEHFVSDVDIELIDQLFSAVLWTIFIGFLTVLFAIIVEWAGVASTDAGVAKLATAAIVMLSVHFVIVIATVLKRLRCVYDAVAMNKRG